MKNISDRSYVRRSGSDIGENGRSVGKSDRLEDRSSELNCRVGGVSRSGKSSAVTDVEATVVVVAGPERFCARNIQISELSEAAEEAQTVPALIITSYWYM